MENIFEFIKALTDAKSEPSIQMPEKLASIGIDKTESDQFENFNKNIWSVWDKYDKITKEDTQCAYFPDTKKRLSGVIILIPFLYRALSPLLLL